jgi:hypothetical protein
MAHLLIGSSNVNRHYKWSDFPDARQYKMVKCTQMPGFKAYMENLNASSQTVLISVIENFVVDAVGADITEPEGAIEKCIKDFLEIVLKSANKLPNAKFGIVMPLGRPSVVWYQERVGHIATHLNNGIKNMVSNKNVNNMIAINCPSETSQQFDPDMIHLTKTSAGVFLDLILEEAERAFNADLVDLTEHGEWAGDESESESGSDRIKKMEDRLGALERTLRIQADKNIANDLMFARSREETDAGTNKIKEDRLVMNGLKSSTPMPAEPKARIEALKKLAAEIFEVLIPSFEGKIIYLSQGKNKTDPIPMIEVRLEKTEHAIALRKAYADKRKNKQLGRELESLFISNSVSLATRVRVDVMKAIARKISNSQDLAYVAGFTSRPMMHIRKAGAPAPNSRPLRSYSYIDTITRFGHRVTVEDLETAYGRAGTSFNGQLQQNFVVLNERDQATLQTVTSGSAPKPGGSGASYGRGGARGGAGGARGGAGGARGGAGDPIRGRGEKRAGTPLEATRKK